MPDPVAGTDAEWAAYTYAESNTRGIVREWWLHVPTAYWFIAERDTASDRVLRTYPASELDSQDREPGPGGAA
jgi:sarcosine oxidase subunit delta